MSSLVRVRRRPVLVSNSMAFVYGPALLTGAPSREDPPGLIEYSIDEVARVFDSVASPSPRREDPEGWSWRWEHGDSWIHIGFRVATPEDFELGGLAWSSSPLDLRAPVGQLVRMWNRIRAELPAIALHDENCVTYDPDGFLAEIASVGSDDSVRGDSVTSGHAGS